MPIATVGFVAAGVIFAVFAVTFLAQVGRFNRLPLRSFGYAYLALAFMLLTLGVGAFMGTEEALKASVIVGNVLLLAGSLLMLSIELEAIQESQPRAEFPEWLS